MVASIQEVNYKKLHLDLANPRLPSDVNKKARDVLTWIAKSTAIEDLMNAIGTNDFFPGEPLVVYPAPGKAGEFIVIEGNRRLTAVKLLHNPQEADKPSAQIVAISEDAKFKPEKIPVVVRDTRAEVLPYLGFRHITGIREWEPLAKARYLEQLFSLTPKKEAPITRYLKVARSIGSRRDNVKRNLDALAVYNVIANNDFFDVDGLSEETIKFAVLSTALADERIGQFVGVTKAPAKNAVDAESIPTNPIVDAAALKKKEIGELTKWIFAKDDGGRTILGESRNLRQLGAVVGVPKALAALRNGSSLALAYRLTSGINEDFMAMLYAAVTSLESAASLVANVNYDEQAFDVAHQAQNLVRTIGTTLMNKRTGAADAF